MALWLLPWKLPSLVTAVVPWPKGMAEKKYVRAEFSQKNLTSKLIQKLLPTHFSFDKASDEDWIHFGEGQSLKNHFTISRMDGPNHNTECS